MGENETARFNPILLLLQLSSLLGSPVVPLRSESVSVNPALNFISNCKRLSWRGGEPTVQFIRIHFQWDGLIGAAAQEASHILSSKIWQSQPFVLDDMDKLVEQEPVCERLVRDHRVHERACGHVREVRQIGR